MVSRICFVWNDEEFMFVLGFRNEVMWVNWLECEGWIIVGEYFGVFGCDRVLL